MDDPEQSMPEMSRLPKNAIEAPLRALVVVVAERGGEMNE